MKAKVYPLNTMVSETSIWASPFCLHLEIICASLAKGTSTIKMLVESEDINTTIKWCENLGATIKKVNNKLIIKGVNNEIKFSSSLFISDGTSVTAKLMLPLLSIVSQPFGIKANEDVLHELDSLSYFYDTYGISHYLENEMIRFESIMNCVEAEFDGSIDIYLSAGILIALPLLNGSSAFRLRAPVRSERSYNLILKILKNYKIDIKHPATMRYEISGNQKYKSCNITTEIDNYYLSILALLSHKIEEDAFLRILNYRPNKLSNEYLLFNFMCEHIATFKKYFPSNSLKRKELDYHKIELNVENSLPFLMVLGVINTKDTIITRVDFSNYHIKKQFDIMEKSFKKLDLKYTCYNNEIVVSPGKIRSKKQLNCHHDPYVAIALSILALLSDFPIVIKNVECIFNVYKDFFNRLLDYGATIEFIHDN